MSKEKGSEVIFERYSPIVADTQRVISYSPYFSALLVRGYYAQGTSLSIIASRGLFYKFVVYSLESCSVVVLFYSDDDVELS